MTNIIESDVRSELTFSVARALAFIVLAVGGAASAEPSRASIEFFETTIRPLLVQHCYECHSLTSDVIQGGLLLDSRAGWQRGGNRGAAIVPGNVEQSLLVQAIRYQLDDVMMPPTGRLSDAEIAEVVRWVQLGAPDPRSSTDQPSKLSGRHHDWSLRPPQWAMPPVDSHGWADSPIDRWIRHSQATLGIVPVAAADPATLLRRVCFDLVGLPPSPEMVRAFLRDPSPSSYVRVVDRLLASSHFGERWGRHWLDVARYADSVGSTANFVMPHAYRYRDYVIDSFNDDKAYDQFVREQIAGDLLRAESADQQAEQRTATGFLALGSRSLAEKDPMIVASDEIAEQVDAIGRAFLGLSLSCARCHDHKFSPVTTEEFYSVAGIFRSTQTLSGLGRLGEGTGTRVRNDLLWPVDARLRMETFIDDRDVLLREFEALSKQLDFLSLRKRQVEDAEPFDKQELEGVFAQQRKVRDQWAELNDQFAEKYGLAMGVTDASQPVDARLEVGGDAHNLGARIDRGFLRTLHKPDIVIEPSSSGRFEFSLWLTDARNPLLGRVAVNRVWHQLFGRGLVRTVDDFTATGAAPTHPELLDSLAVQFVDDGYSIKRLIRQIVLSRVYRLSTNDHVSNRAIDPDNIYLWRANRRRLEIEPLRDAILIVSGRLDTRRPGQLLPTIKDRVPNEPEKWPDTLGSAYRSVYLPVLRRALSTMHQQFDFAPPDQVSGARSVTLVPTQALFLMNSDFVKNQCSAAARRLMRQFSNTRQRAEFCYLTILGRRPSTEDFERIERFVELGRADGMGEPVIWEDIVHALLSSAEFVYRN